MQLSRVINTPLDVPVALYLSTAIVGVWAAYDVRMGSTLFTLITVGIFLYYWLADSSEQTAWKVIDFVGSVCSFLTIYFVASHDWQHMPANFALLNRITNAWMAVRPDLPLPPIHPNIIAGNLAAVFPLVSAACIYYYKQSHPGRLRTSLVSLFIISFGLVMTSSRAAWIFLFGGLILWGILAWWENSKPQTDRLFGSILLCGMLLSIVLLWLFYRLGFFTFLVSNSVTLTSRLNLAYNTLVLAADTPLTGAGLGSFPGIYSSYILLIPVRMFSYAHNLYLDIFIEQGILGLLAWIGYWFGCVGLLIRYIWTRKRLSNKSIHPLAIPLLCGLVVVTLHGLIDNPFAEPWSRPFIGLLPGLSIAVIQTKVWYKPKYNQFAWYVLGLLLVLLGGGIMLSRPLAAIWQSNLGSVEMAQRALSDWPTGEWQTQAQVFQFVRAEQYFEQALRSDPANITAHFRIGLIALQNLDFPNARFHLEAAYQSSPNHRGVTKALGYCYLWQGELIYSLELLRKIPETYQELHVYTNWWMSQGKTDLSAYAEKAITILADE